MKEKQIKEKEVKKSRPQIPTKTKIILWSKSAGRCQFDNCPEALNVDRLTQTDNNSAYVAHIYGYAKGSERFDEIKSPKLEKDISNLMLLCDVCHRRIDEKKIGAKKYPADVLLEMKKRNEERIHLLTSIKPNLDSHVVIYKANIGEHSPVISYESVREFLPPENYPAQNRAIDLSLSGSYFRDKDQSFWDIELENLKSHYERDLYPLIVDNSIKHISLFAFAPMPLLIKLGTLLGDKVLTNVRQYDRNSGSWNFFKKGEKTNYIVTREGKEKSKNVVLNISLSANISNNRITSVLGDECTIYTLTIDNPNNAYLVSKKQLDDFTIVIRKLLNEIKIKYSSSAPLYVFPAMPIATAIELGRFWMPKADMPLIIYDENKLNEGFKKAIEIN